jgi:subtilase family serine protease
VVTAQLTNLSYYAVADASIELLIDGSIVDQRVIDEVEPLDPRPITLTWISATSGRHALQLIVDPGKQIAERHEDNNRLND